MQRRTPLGPLGFGSTQSFGKQNPHPQEPSGGGRWRGRPASRLVAAAGGGGGRRRAPAAAAQTLAQPGRGQTALRVGACGGVVVQRRVGAGGGRDRRRSCRAPGGGGRAPPAPVASRAGNDSVRESEPTIEGKFLLSKEGAVWFFPCP